MNRPSDRSDFPVREVDWNTAEPQLREIRQQVFIAEQQVPTALEWDGLDEDAIHLLAFDAEHRSVGCARILDGGTIGRMAVLKDYRGKGLGRALLDMAIEVCRRRDWHRIKLSAQTHAIPFYERAGFRICSDEYLDAGIPHRDMQLELSD